MIPLFYFLQDTKLVIAPTITQVIARLSDLTLDDPALAFFLRCGYFLGDDTPFAKIKRVPPGATIEANQSGFIVTRPPDSTSRQITGLTKKAAQTYFADLFQDTIKNIVSDNAFKTCLPLSGGKDSRHILYALTEENKPPDICVTVKLFPPSEGDDAETASEVARHLGLPHVILDEPRSCIKSELEKNILTDFCALEHRWALPVNEFTRASNCDVIYDGIAGDVLSAGLFLTRERLNLFEQQQYTLLSEDILGADHYLAKFLNSKSKRRWSKALAVDRLSDELKRFEDRNNPVTEFFLENRTRRAIAPASWKIFSGSGVPVAPFLSRGVFQFLRSLPPGFILDKNFHENTIIERYREHKKLPFAKKSKKIRNRAKIDVICAIGSYIALSKPGRATYLNRPFILLKLAQALASAQDGTILPGLLRKPIYLSQIEKLSVDRSQVLTPEPCRNSGANQT